MSKFAILLAGDFNPTPRALQQLRGARVIAADSGIKHAEALGLEPELWVGDFDSAHPEQETRHSSVERKVYPAAKDKTDGELAIDAALAGGATELILVGALGGQFDHSLSHALQMVALAEKGMKISATTGREEAWPIISSLSLWQLPRGTRMSVLGLTPLTRLSIRGVRWPLEDRDVPLGSTLTLSNEAAGGDISISLGQGCAIALLHHAVTP